MSIKPDSKFAKSKSNLAYLLSTLSVILLPFTANALSATTVNTIQGTIPFLKFDNVAINNMDDLLSFTLPDGTSVTPSTTGALNVAPTATFSEVVTLVTADGSMNNLSTVSAVTYNDSDGDTPHATAPVAGTLTATWTYRSPDNSIITLGSGDLSNNFDACKSPYTLTIAASGVKAQSAYGDPRNNNYGSQSKSYRINVKDYKLCYIRPDLTAYTSPLQCGVAGMCKYTSGYNSAVFVPKGGFLPNASKKFPTVGFNGAKFALTMSGLWTDYTYSSNNSIAPIDSNGIVTLLSSTRPSLPVNVTLTATPKDTTYPAQTYSFKINKWPKGVSARRYNSDFYLNGTYDAAIFCGAPAGLSGFVNRYTAASYLYSRAELTNSPYAVGTGKGGLFSRDIDGTFTGEWGNLYEYLGSGFAGTNYTWTGDAPDAPNDATVDQGTGSVGANLLYPNVTKTYVAACK